MKALSVIALLLFVAACASTESAPMKPPQSTDRSDSAHQELDKEMGK